MRMHMVSMNVQEYMHLREDDTGHVMNCSMSVTKDPEVKKRVISLNPTLTFMAKLT